MIFLVIFNLKSLIYIFFDNFFLNKMVLSYKLEVLICFIFFCDFITDLLSRVIVSS